MWCCCWVVFCVDFELLFLRNWLKFLSLFKIGLLIIELVFEFVVENFGGWLFLLFFVDIFFFCLGFFVVLFVFVFLLVGFVCFLIFGFFLEFELFLVVLLFGLEFLLVVLGFKLWVVFVLFLGRLLILVFFFFCDVVEFFWVMDCLLLCFIWKIRYVIISLVINSIVIELLIKVKSCCCFFVFFEIYCLLGRIGFLELFFLEFLLVLIFVFDLFFCWELEVCLMFVNCWLLRFVSRLLMLLKLKLVGWLDGNFLWLMVVVFVRLFGLWLIYDLMLDLLGEIILIIVLYLGYCRVCLIVECLCILRWFW